MSDAYKPSSDELMVLRLLSEIERLEEKINDLQNTNAFLRDDIFFLRERLKFINYVKYFFGFAADRN